jgi:hypothetical protein
MLFVYFLTGLYLLIFIASKARCGFLSGLLFNAVLLFQIIGNLLYYRYMNPAIVAPDAFDIIDLSAGGQLTTDQRRNLGSIAKMLQHAASNKMFLGDNAHLSIINEYLSQSYQKFR